MDRNDGLNDNRGTVKDRIGDPTERDGKRDVNLGDSRKDDRGNLESERSNRSRNDGHPEPRAEVSG